MKLETKLLQTKIVRVPTGILKKIESLLRGGSPEGWRLIEYDLNDDGFCLCVLEPSGCEDLEDSFAPNMRTKNDVTQALTALRDGYESCLRIPLTVEHMEKLARKGKLTIHQWFEKVSLGFWIEVTRARRARYENGTKLYPVTTQEKESEQQILEQLAFEYRPSARGGIIKSNQIDYALRLLEQSIAKRVERKGQLYHNIEDE